MAGTNEAFSRDARLLAAVGKGRLVGNAGPVVGDAVVGADRRRRRELLVARSRLAGATEAQAEASVPKVTLRVIDVGFDAIPDLKERASFMNLPTSFVLPADDVDRLREVAGRLMRQSADYQALVREFGGAPAK
jgi:hypothetical protein